MCSHPGAAWAPADLPAQALHGLAVIARVIVCAVIGERSG